MLDAHSSKEVVMFKLVGTQINLLRKLQESGMGYQFVYAKLNEESATNYIAFNCQLILQLKELHELKYGSMEDLLKSVEAARTFEPLRLIDYEEMAIPATKAGLGVFAPAPRIIRKTIDYEGFARLSPFPNDWRIQDDGSIAEGTYATTVADLSFIPSGFAAAGRYALPNPASAKYVYIIVPGAGHKIDGGTVRPANNQAGGGVEVLFVDGAPQGSAHRPYLIPEL